MKSCEKQSCLSLNCVNSMTKGKVQLDFSKEQNKRMIFNEFVKNLKTKKNVELSCVAHKIRKKANQIQEESKEQEVPLKCAFLLDTLPRESVLKLNKKEELSVEDCFFLSLVFSLNDILNLKNEQEINIYFKNMNEFFDLIQEYDPNEALKFLNIYVDKLAWEFSDFLQHLSSKNLSVEHLILFVKFLCNQMILFSFDFFEKLGTLKSIINLLQWKKFEYLFTNSTEEEMKNILTINENEKKLKIQSSVTKQELERITEDLLNFITINLLEEEKFSKMKATKVEILRPVCQLMDFVFNFNQYLSPRVRLEDSQFINPFLSDDYKYKHCLIFYMKPKIMTQKKFSQLRKFFRQEYEVKSFNFLNYPFLYSVERKVEILELENHIEQQFNFREGFSIMNLLQMGRLSLGLDLNISRNNILEDALSQLNKPDSVKNLRKPLKVTFKGEPGMDEGGLTKEFFHLITQQLFDPNFGMFTVKNKAFCWFKQDSMAFNLNFELIGMLMGLAIYNKTLLDVKFPLALYKKLLIEHYTKHNIRMAQKDFLNLEDLREFDPQLYATLSNILELDLPEDNEVGITFEITYESWDVKKNYNLIENGHRVKVTNNNKEFFVKKYLDWVFNKSIQKEFKYFSVGFFKVLGDSVLQFFSSEDLLMTICGQTKLNFEELKEGATYHDGFLENSPTCLHFWKILLEEFDQNDRRRFLKFLTGNDRAPLRGLKQIKIKISK